MCHRLDELDTAHSFYGVRRMTEVLRREGHAINPKRVRRLLRQMGLLAVYPKPRLSAPAWGQSVFPYRLRGLAIEGPHQLWAIDITCVRLRGGFACLVAMREWFSRYGLAWELANTMDSEFCIRAWEAALAQGQSVPLTSNTDQGAQFTSDAYGDAVQSAGTDVSMDGRGRWVDNRFIERLWRSVKYEDIYRQAYGDGLMARRGLSRWFVDYNKRRPHQALNYATPEQWDTDPLAYGAKPASWAW